MAKKDIAITRKLPNTVCQSTSGTSVRRSTIETRGCVSDTWLEFPYVFVRIRIEDLAKDRAQLKVFLGDREES